MTSLSRRLEILEQRFSQSSGAYQLSLLYRCISGDEAAGREFEALVAAGKSVGLLHELYLSIKHAVGIEQTPEAESEGL
jgi:hypothetical protein